MNAIDATKIRIQTGQIQNFFDILTDILLKISGGKLYKNQNFKKYFNSYIFCRYISMKDELRVYAQMFNQLQTIISNEQMYVMAYKYLPKQKSGFIKYIKKQKKDSKQKDEENLINTNEIEDKISLFDI